MLCRVSESVGEEKKVLVEYRMKVLMNLKESDIDIQEKWLGNLLQLKKDQQKEEEEDQKDDEENENENENHRSKKSKM